MPSYPSSVFSAHRNSFLPTSTVLPPPAIPMPDEPMTRSEVAAEADVNPETLRYYERKGVIPDPPRTAAGYRQYDASYVQRLQFIQRGQELGFTLQEIKELLALRIDEDRTCDDIRQHAAKKKEEVEEKLRDLRRIRSALDVLIATCREEGPTGECPILEALSDPEALEAAFSSE